MNAFWQTAHDANAELHALITLRAMIKKSAHHPPNPIQLADHSRYRPGHRKSYHIGFFSGSNLLFVGVIIAIAAFVFGLVYAVLKTLAASVVSG